MMKFKNIAVIVLVVAFLSVGAFNASAQTVYGLSLVQYNSDPQNVEGLSATWLDYYAGLYYDPEVIGDLYRTDDPETSLDAGQDFGEGYWDDAVVELFTTNYVPGKTYCTFSQHAIWSYFVVGGGGSYWDPFGYGFMEGTWGGTWDGMPFGYYYIAVQRHFIGWTQACITIPIPPTPTPTPTPTPDPCDPQNYVEGCATPTPEPSPSVRISEVGFTGDRLIRQLEVNGNPYIDSPDGTVSTWKDTNDPEYPVAYLKGTSPVLFAKFSFTPTLTSNLSAHIRVKRGSTVVTSSNIAVTLNGSQVRVDNIMIPFSNLEEGPYVKMSKYKFEWEISFDNGSTWKSVGDQSEHKVHWLNSNPVNEATFEPFNNRSGITYQGLYDKALEWSTGKIESNQNDVKKVIQRINSKLAEKVRYKPGNGPVNQHPLRILTGLNSGGAVCDDNARLLAGLLRSVGLEAQENFHFGGDVTTLKRNYYCGPGGCGSNGDFDNRFTLQAKRDMLGRPGDDPTNPLVEAVEQNPSFTFHATVVNGSDSYDPSYGIVEGEVQFLTALKIVSGQSPVCVHGPEATAQRVTLSSFGSASLGANNNPGTICQPVITGADIRRIRFDENGGSQPATMDYATGTWNVQGENSEPMQIQGYQKTATVGVFLTGDYDGDGIVDPASWSNSGLFKYKLSSLAYYEVSRQFVPLSGEIAVIGDYDGDGKTDIARWRKSDGRFQYLRSSDGYLIEEYWGLSGDIPVPGDYDGDGKTDIAVYRPSNGEWWVWQSSTNQSWAVDFGEAGDIPVQGDYDGDGKTDVVVVRPSDGGWHLLMSESGYAYSGVPGPAFDGGDWPVPADYNKDGKTDVAVWFNDTGKWFIVDSQTGDARTQFLGRPEDRPIQALSIIKPY